MKQIISLLLLLQVSFLTSAENSAERYAILINEIIEKYEKNQVVFYEAYNTQKSSVVQQKKYLDR